MGDRHPMQQQYRNVLETAHAIATRYLDEVAQRHVGGNATPATLANALGGPLPDGGTDPGSGAIPPSVGHRVRADACTPEREDVDRDDR